MFKIGDKVRYNNPVHDTTPATVVGIMDEDYVQVDTHGGFGICLEHISALRLVESNHEPTRIALVPGTYGKVRITEGKYIHCNSMSTAAEVRETITTLEKILEAL